MFFEFGCKGKTLNVWFYALNIDNGNNPTSLIELFALTHVIFRWRNFNSRYSVRFIFILTTKFNLILRSGKKKTFYGHLTTINFFFILLIFWREFVVCFAISSRFWTSNQHTNAWKWLYSVKSYEVLYMFLSVQFLYTNIIILWKISACGLTGVLNSINACSNMLTRWFQS